MSCAKMPKDSELPSISHDDPVLGEFYYNWYQRWMPYQELLVDVQSRGLTRTESEDRAAPCGNIHHRDGTNFTREPLASVYNATIGNPTAAVVGAQQIPDSPLDRGLVDSDSIGQTPVTPDTVSYPTDAREKRKKREQAARERGEKLEVKHKQKYVEATFDDCGDNLSSLGIDERSVAQICTLCLSPEDWLEDAPLHDPIGFDVLRSGILDGISAHFFWRAGVRHARRVVSDQYFTKADEVFVALDRAGKGIDLAEISGNATKTILAIRRHLTAECVENQDILQLLNYPNVDILWEFDLSRADNQKAVLDYFSTNQVQIAVTTAVTGPMVALCGAIAIIQSKKNLHWMFKQSHTTTPSNPRFLSQKPWPHICERWSTFQVLYDRCTVGRKTKEPIAMIASCEELVAPFRDHLCDGRHDHAQVSV